MPVGSLEWHHPDKEEVSHPPREIMLSDIATCGGNPEHPRQLIIRTKTPDEKGSYERIFEMDDERNVIQWIKTIRLRITYEWRVVLLKLNGQGQQYKVTTPLQIFYDILRTVNENGIEKCYNLDEITDVNVVTERSGLLKSGQVPRGLEIKSWVEREGETVREWTLMNSTGSPSTDMEYHVDVKIKIDLARAALRIENAGAGEGAAGGAGGAEASQTLKAGGGKRRSKKKRTKKRRTKKRRSKKRRTSTRKSRRR